MVFHSVGLSVHSYHVGHLRLFKMTLRCPIEPVFFSQHNRGSLPITPPFVMIIDDFHRPLGQHLRCILSINGKFLFSSISEIVTVKGFLLYPLPLLSVCPSFVVVTTSHLRMEHESSGMKEMISSAAVKSEEGIESAL